MVCKLNLNKCEWCGFHCVTKSDRKQPKTDNYTSCELMHRIVCIHYMYQVYLDNTF